MLRSLHNHLPCIREHKMPMWGGQTAWRQIPNRLSLFTVIYGRYSVFFGMVNADVRSY